MDEELIRQEFELNESYFFDSSNWQPVQLTRAWAKALPAEAGVYMLFDQGELVYVGETGKISGRALDMLDSRHHTVRRSIGEELFSHLKGYKKASAKEKHPPQIEELVQSKMLELHICAKPLNIGRKEFEEYISGKHDPKFNRSKKRT